MNLETAAETAALAPAKEGSPLWNMRFYQRPTTLTLAQPLRNL